MELLRKKGTATWVVFPMVDSNGDVVSGIAGDLEEEFAEWNDTAEPPASFTALTNSAAEIGTEGVYKLKLETTEVDSDLVYVKIRDTGGNDAKTQHILIRTMVGDPANLATTTSGGVITLSAGGVNVEMWDGDLVPSKDDGRPEVDLTYIKNVAVNTAVAQLGVNVVSLDNDVITSAKFDETTAFPVKSADSGATQIARVGADGDTLETLSDQLDGIYTDTQAILLDTGTTLDTIVDTIAANIVLILEDTGTTLPATLTTILANIAIVDGIVDDILVDTAVIGAAGAGLTAVPWNAAWDAETQSEVQDALEANNLDHLMKVAVVNNADMTAEVVDGTVLSNIMTSDSDTSGYVVASDSLEALRDNMVGGDAPTIAAAVWDKLTSAITTAGSIGVFLKNLSSTAGSGAITFTYTLTDADSGLPIADADIWITVRDGSDIIASGKTDQNGEVVAYLDAGNIDVYRQKTGYNFVPNPDPETVA